LIDSGSFFSTFYGFLKTGAGLDFLVTALAVDPYKLKEYDINKN